MTSTFQILIPKSIQKSVFDYTSDLPLKIGDIVQVPFRGSILQGVVYSNLQSTFAVEKLKSIIGQIADYSVGEPGVRFIKFASYYNICSMGSILKLILPMEVAPYQSDSQVVIKPTLHGLNAEQRHASDFLKKQIIANKYSTTLLEGLTGSGKTEVYCHAIAQILEQATGQVLVLLPEIMLTHQFVKTLKQRFQIEPDIWHSKISTKKKGEMLSKILSGDARLVLGARSALFLPFKDLKIIILDEEHDQSYKQENHPSYHARDMAVAYASFKNIPVVLISATPSVESMHNANIGKYHHITLSSRFENAQLPTVTIVDMKKQNLHNAWISSVLKDKIDQYLGKNEQILLFLNRKGFATLTLCRSCGYREKCINCDICLVHHKSSNKLLCHHCGYSRELSNICNGCQKEGSLLALGPGVERIEEEVKRLWPAVSVAVITAEQKASESKGVIEKIIKREVQIVIGTQILSKGYHFPHLNLVGIIDADTGLMGSDFRASEKTYQLLTQISGRAGRESYGEVVIQTYVQENKILEAIKAQNNNRFYSAELDSRNTYNMPPFTRIISILLEAKDQAQVERVTNLMLRNAPYSQKIQVLGPAPAPIFYLKGKYRYRFLVKASTRCKAQDIVMEWVQKTHIPAAVTIKIDVDAQTFL